MTLYHVVLLGNVTKKQWYYQKSHDHKTRQVDSLSWQASTYNVTSPFHHMVLQGYMANQSHYIFTTRVPIPTKHSKMAI